MASSICGAKLDVSPVYQIGSPALTTSVATRLSMRTVLDRLSIMSWPLMASMAQRPPLRTATLTRSQSMSRRPSLAIVYAVIRGLRLAWIDRVNSSNCVHSACRVEKFRNWWPLRKSVARSHICSTNRR